MPIYEYWCTECRAAFEELRPMSSKDNEVTCPRCGSAVKRMVSVFVVVGRDAAGGSESYSAGGCACGGACSCGSRN